ncbi:MAG: diaminopimelate decarboxylase [Chloroflexia bacterium]
MDVRGNRLFFGEFAAEELAARYGTPLYVYETSTIARRYAELVQHIPYRPLRIHYACKANSNLEILRLVHQLGAGAETVSPGEIRLALAAGFAPHEILFTCSNIGRAELVYVLEQGVMVHLDSLGQIRHAGELAPGLRVSLRINQGIGAGHHRHVITGGPESKFGIPVELLPDALALAGRYGLKVVGIHQHIGSNVLDAAILLEAMDAQLRTAASIAGLEFIDLGGGLGIPYRPEEKPLDLPALGKQMCECFARFCETYGRPLEMILEPGRYLVAEAGTLLATVTDIKRTPHRSFVGIDSGLNHLIRPALYGAYHEIVNASRVEGDREVACVAGNICESGDLFAHDRLLPRFQEGDILALLKVGAYGYAMSSNYNARPRPAEVLVDGHDVRLIRERESI